MLCHPSCQFWNFSLIHQAWITEQTETPRIKKQSDFRSDNPIFTRLNERRAFIVYQRSGLLAQDPRPRRSERQILVLYVDPKNTPRKRRPALLAHHKLHKQRRVPLGTRDLCLSSNTLSPTRISVNSLSIQEPSGQIVTNYSERLAGFLVLQSQRERARYLRLRRGDTHAPKEQIIFYSQRLGFYCNPPP